jgi:hypothetical protein
MVVMRERSLIDTHGQALEQGPVVFAPALPTNWPPGGTARALSPERSLCGRSLDGRLADSASAPLATGKPHGALGMGSGRRSLIW